VAFYRGADGAALTFNLDSEKSFKNLDLWKEEILLQANPKTTWSFPFILLGNKSDLHRTVSQDQIQDWCKLNGNIPYYEISAKDNLNIDKAFMNLAKIALQYKRNEGYDERQLSLEVLSPTGEPMSPSQRGSLQVENSFSSEQERIMEEVKQNQRLIKDLQQTIENQQKTIQTVIQLLNKQVKITEELQISINSLKKDLTK